MPVRVAIVGAGIIGASWALHYARAGATVRVWTRSSARRATLLERIRESAVAARVMAPDLAVDTVLSRITIVDSVAATVADAHWVQESIRESEEEKAALFAELDAVAPPAAILASSTSSIGASRFTASLAGRARCLVAHPATPPHLLPVIEVVPSEWTDPTVTTRAFALLRDTGLVPVLVRRERPGFVMNRLQGALLTEMLSVVRDGLMSPEDVDALIRDGFGLRWAFLGPLEGVHLNAPGGIADYLTRYGFMFNDAARERGEAPVVTPALVESLDRALQARCPLPALPARITWRDRRLAALRALRDRMASDADPGDQARAVR